ncbi:MAG: HdeD family acid-resistance protein [Pirellulales bacterium]
MYPESLETVHRLRMHGLALLHRRWGWFAGIGAVLLALGAAVILSTTLQTGVTLATMSLVGWLLVFGGALQVGHAFLCKDWSGFIIDLLVGVAYTVVGAMIAYNPVPLAAAFTFLIGVLFLCGGAFRLIAGLSVAYPNRGWLLLNGAINILLGASILSQWPSDTQWVIGLFIGIEVLFNGWSLLMLGLAAKKLTPRALPSDVIDASKT